MLITAIRQTSPGRLSVCFDDETEIKSTLAVVSDLRLFSGRELDEDELSNLKLHSELGLAKERALNIISRRQMSHKELRDKLVQKGFGEETARCCADWLEENGLINDENYAAALARHYSAKGYGAGRLRSELSKRGISRELWEDALESMPVNESKIDKFIAARLDDPQDRDQLRKLSNALFRRGFSWDEIRAALERFNAEEY